MSGTGYFIDLVPSRILLPLGAINNTYISYESDKKWIRRVDLKFQLRDDMNEELKEVVSLEYDIQDECYIIYNVRQALARYVVRQFLERRVEGRDRPIFEYIGSNPPLSSFDDEPE